MPYLPETRQYRNFAATNFKPVIDDNVDGEASFRTRGHFTTFNSPYELVPGFFEEIDRHAFDGTDMSDTLFQFNHGGMVLARIRNGSLQVGVDDSGGWALADLSGCQQARDVYEAIQNGLIDRMSFGFTIAPNGVEYVEDADGTIHSRITKVEKLYDVSCVDLPANEGTDISARSYADAVIEARNKRVEAEAAAACEAERRAAEEAAEQERIAKEQADKLALLRLRARKISIN